MTLRDTIRTKPRLWASAGLVTVGLAGGAVLGTTLTANAATSTGSSTTSTSGSATAPAMPAMPPHGSAAHENAETPVTGAAAAKAQAAAVKYVGSGTAGAVTTDFTKHGYEVTVTKSDGSKVEVHLDSNFAVMQRGPGGPGGWRGGPGAPAGQPSSSALG